MTDPLQINEVMVGNGRHKSVILIYPPILIASIRLGCMAMACLLLWWIISSRESRAARTTGPICRDYAGAVTTQNIIAMGRRGGGRKSFCNNLLTGEPCICEKMSPMRFRKQQYAN